MNLPVAYAPPDEKRFWAKLKRGLTREEKDELQHRVFLAMSYDERLEHCDRPEQAMPLIEWAVDGNYCSFPMFDLDPVWTKIRDNPDFQRIRAKGKACHEKFRRAVEAHDARA